MLNWLVGVKVNHNHHTPLDAHNGDERKGFIKNKAMEAVVKKNVEKIVFISSVPMLPNQSLRVMVPRWCKTNILPMPSCTKWSIHFLNMHVAHVNGHCKGINTKLWLLSHIMMLPMKISLSIMEHGMDLFMEGWHPCLCTHNIFQMMGTLLMMVMMNLLKVRKG